MGSWERSNCCTSTLPPARIAFDIIPGVSEPTPIAVPAELEGLNDTTPGLISALRDARVAGETGSSLDEREIELVRIATLVALGAPAASFRAHVTRALSAGASVDEVWGSVAAIATLVGVPRLIASAPHIAAALEGHEASREDKPTNQTFGRL